MSLVNALRFSKYDGAMISDEEFWLHGRRRTFFQDNLHSLLSPQLSDETSVDLLYGGTGDPYFHHEVVTKAQDKLATLMSNGPIKGQDSPVYEASKEVMKVVHKVTRTRVEQKLHLLYGFGVDDFNRGYYEKNGKKYQIKQECVHNKASNFISWTDKNKEMKPIFDSRALIMGYDPKDGVQLFYVNVENQVLCFNSGDYDTVGTGIYGAGHVFSNYMRQKTMDKRMVGYPRVEAMVMLIDSAITASQTYKAIGGYFNILYLDGRKKKHCDRIKSIIEDRAKLTIEVVMAYKKDLVDTKTCYELIDNLVFQDAAVEEMDERFFQKARNAEKLELFLRGYKLDYPSEETMDLAKSSDLRVVSEEKGKNKKNNKKGGAA